MFANHLLLKSEAVGIKNALTWRREAVRCHKQLRLNFRLSLRIATQWSQVRIHLDVKVGWVYTENHMRADPSKEVEALATIVRSVVIRLRICEARVPVGHSVRSASAAVPSMLCRNVLPPKGVERLNLRR